MRLIDADELRKCAIPCQIHNGASTDLCVPLYQIDNAPTVKPERPQGEWLTFSTNHSIIQCSECTALLNNLRADIFKDKIGKMNFCPNCGAKMQKGDTE